MVGVLWDRFTFAEAAMATVFCVILAGRTVERRNVVCKGVAAGPAGPALAGPIFRHC